MKNVFFILCFFFFAGTAPAQVDSTKSENLLQTLDSLNQKTQLLPNKIIFTQKVLWGQNGLMRNFERFELTREKRQQELNLRRKMLIAHQAFGFATLCVMIAQGIIGAKLYNGQTNLKDTHEALGAAVNIGYF